MIWCVDNRSGRPAALQYFDYIGQDPISVEWIIASHWHDDHVKGLAETLKACRAARFCSSSALSADEFLATVAPYDQRANFQRGSGVSELFNVLEELKRSGRSPAKKAGPDRRIDFLLSTDRPYQCEIWTLSPSDEQVNRFLIEIGKLVPQLRETRRPFPTQHVNDLSVVTLLSIGSFAVVLAADLEETTSEHTGWTPIVASTGRPQVKAGIFKVPHHGSENGHSEDAWQNLLTPKPIALTTPYNRGRKALPSKSDKVRIASLSSDFYLTSVTNVRRIKRDAAVEKTIREIGQGPRVAEPMTGIVRLRNGGLAAPEDWTVEFGGDAYKVIA